MEKDLTSKLSKFILTGTLASSLLFTGSSKQKTKDYVAYDAPRAQSIIGEEVIDVDRDGKIDYIVDSPYPSNPVYIVAFKKGYKEKAGELGCILRRGAKEMDAITEEKAQNLFIASEEYRKLREQ